VISLHLNKSTGHKNTAASLLIKLLMTMTPLDSKALSHRGICKMAYWVILYYDKRLNQTRIDLVELNKKKFNEKNNQKIAWRGCTYIDF
jgi:hypothetical protein